MASTRIYRTSGTPTNRKKFTISCWLKKSKLSDDMQIVNFYEDASNRTQFSFNSSDQFDFIVKSGNTNTMRLKTTRVFRDPSAWYHIVMTVDTTQATNTDRLKVYINGEQNLSANNGFASETYPSQNADATVGGTHNIGAYDNGGSPTLYWDGLLAHLHYTDGYAYAASDFGETDSTSGIWKPKTAPSVTYGTNGFFLKFENSNNLDLDSSGNNLSFTTSGTLTQNVDTPSNNFATMNPLVFSTLIGYTNGNLTCTNTSSTHRSVLSTLAVSSGKWYWEGKSVSTGAAYPTFGIFNADATFDSGTYFTATANGYGYNSEGNIFHNNTNHVTGLASWTDGDIIGVALDATNNKIYFSKNGSWQNSGDPSNNTGGTSITADTTWFFAGHMKDGGTDPVQSYNFGSGFFGTTAVASANADANGHGKMEYTVPTGFYTLCTKNIKEFG